MMTININLHKYYVMSCNCGKTTIPLSLKKKLRRKTKEYITEVKRLWHESADTIIIDKDKLGFKEIKQNHDKEV